MGCSFLAILTYSAVAVPVLHEFKAENIHYIVNHSDARLLLVGDMVWPELDEKEMPALEGIIMLNDYSLLVSRTEKLTYAREHLNEMFGKKYPKKLPHRACPLRTGPAGTTRTHQLHVRHDKPLQRSHDPLSGPLVKHSVCLRSIAPPQRRPAGVHAAHGSHVRIGF